MQTISKRIALCGAMCIIASCAFVAEAQQVDYSVVSVPEEAGVEFRRITSASDLVCMPMVKRQGKDVQWFTNRVLAMVPGADEIAYLSFRGDATNIFLKDVTKQGGSRQRTNRTAVIDFSYSPDGKTLYFSERRGKNTQIFSTDGRTGYICRQITDGATDMSPLQPQGTDQVFFTRVENNGASIWSYSLAERFLSNYVGGQNPEAVPGKNLLLVSRSDAFGRGELWKIDLKSGEEECILSDPARSFSTPMVSSDGKRIVLVGSSLIEAPGMAYPNTDIFVCNIDGTDLRQLTYHAADDLSPVWSPDDKYIYFVSQRGDAGGIANIWRMTP